MKSGIISNLRVLTLCGVISLIAQLKLGFCDYPSWGHDREHIPYNPRESGLSGFEHLSRQYEVGPGGDLTYTVPLLSLPGRIQLDLNLTYTSGIKVDQSATWVGLGWSLAEFAVKRISVFGDDGIVFADGLIGGGSGVDYFPPVNDQYEVIIPGRSLKFINFGTPREPKFAPTNFTADSLYCDTHFVDMSGVVGFSSWPVDHNIFVLVTADGTKYIFDYALKRAGQNWDIPIPWGNPLCDIDLGICNTVNYMWLLTAILSPDYVDGSNPPDNNPLNSVDLNKGYWIALTYSWNNQPADTNTKRTCIFGEANEVNGSSANYYDTTEITYPFRIVTPTHVLQFVTQPKHLDNYRCLRSGPASNALVCDETDTLGQRTRDRELVAIRLFRKGSGNGSTPEGDILNEYRLEYEETNCLKPLGHTRAGYGEITLKKVYQTGVDTLLVGAYNSSSSPSPYIFSYGRDDALQYELNGERYGWWTNGITGATGQKVINPFQVPSNWSRDFFGYFDINNTDTLEQTSWQLTEVSTPAGAKIKFDWQADSYKWFDPEDSQLYQFKHNGGTRVKQIIILKEGNMGGPTDTITYQYGINSNGWGFPNSMPPVYEKWKNQHEKCTDTIWLFNTDNVNHMVYYPLITEIYQSRGLKGKKETYYLTSDSIGIDSVRSFVMQVAQGWDYCPYPPYSPDYYHVINMYWDRSALMGHPYKVVLKDKDNNIISTETREYSFHTKFSDTSEYIGYDVPIWGGDTIATSCFVSMDKVTTVKNGVEKLTEYTYNGLGLIVEVKENGTEYGADFNRIAHYSYAHDQFPEMGQIHMLSQIDTVRINSTDRFGKKTTSSLTKFQWRDYDSGTALRYFPSKKWEWKDKNLNHAPIDEGEEILAEIYDLYDAYGSLAQWTDAKGVRYTTRYGKNLMPVLEASNAEEKLVTYNDFEQGWAFDGWSSYDGSVTSEEVFSGDSVIRQISDIYSYGIGAEKIIGPLDRTTNFVFSGWVKCNAPGVAKLVIEGLGSSHVEAVHSGSGKWELLEVSLPIPSGTNLIAHTVLYGAYNSAPDTAYFDELRVCPESALVTTKVYDGNLNLTATSDENGLTKRFLYDGRQRLVTETDETGSPIYGRAYHNSIDDPSCQKSPGLPCVYSEVKANSILEIQATEKGHLDDFSSNSISANSPYVIAGSPVYDSLKNSIKLPSGSSLRLSFTFSDADVSLNFIKHYPICYIDSGILTVTFFSGSNYYRAEVNKTLSNNTYIALYKSSGTGPVLLDTFNFSITTTSYSPEVIYNLHFARIGKHLYVFLNGQVVNSAFDTTISSFDAIEIKCHCDTILIDNFGLYNQPILTRHFYGGLGNKFQTVRDDGQDVHALESVYDYFQRPALTTKEVIYPNSYLDCQTDLFGELTGWQLGQSLSTASYVERYYKTSNGLPDCQGYPYSYTNILPEPDSRPLEQSFPGIDFRPGGGHSLTYTYRSLNQDELTTPYHVNDLLVTRIKDENGNYLHQYWDQFDHLIASRVDSAGLNLVTRLTYDPLDNHALIMPPLCAQMYNKYTSRYRFNSLSQLMAKRTADSDTTRYEYDLMGNLKYIQDANQKPSGQFTTRNYDPFDHFVLEGVEKSQPFAFDDTLRPPLSEAYGTDGNEWKIKRFYDQDFMQSGPNYCAGLLTQEYLNWNQEVSPEAISRYRYDQSSNLIEQRVLLTDLPEKSLKFHYNLQGQVDTIYYPDNTKVSYTYDHLGRLGKVGDGTTSDRYAIYSYYPGDLVKSVAFKNGSGGVIQTMDYKYNTRDWLISINDGNAVSATTGTGDHFGLSLSYDWVGNITTARSKLSPLGSSDIRKFTFTYDKANRLTGADDSSNNSYDEIFGYDANGNILGLLRGGANHLYAYYDSTNKVKNVSGWGQVGNNYSYDANGNMVKDSVKILSGMVYDYRNLLTQAVINTDWYPDTLLFYYDGNGQRVKKVYLKRWRSSYGCCKCDEINAATGPGTEGVITEPQGVIGDGVGTEAAVPGCDPPCVWGTCWSDHVDTTITYYILSGDQILAEYDKSNNLIAKYVYANGERIAKIANNTVYYFLKDHLGSTRAVIDQAGTVQARYNYYAYGEDLYAVVTIGTDYKYIGKEFDEESGLNLYYLGNRYYDAKKGGFTSLEPLAEEYPGWSPYVYALDNPLKLVDRDGRFPIPFLLAIAGAVIYGADVANAPAEAEQAVEGPSTLETIGGMAGGALTGFGAGAGVIAFGKEILGAAGVPVDVLDVAKVAKGSVRLGGRLGGVKHRQTVKETAKKLKKEGYTIEHGGGVEKEEYLPGPRGAKKGANYPDITATKGGKTVRVQVGKQTKKGRPISRERKKIEEIKKKEKDDEVRFVPTNEEQ